jgi:UDP-glucose:(heptosyl)LPS alpha-1,3-glucosyltransferase
LIANSELMRDDIGSRFGVDASLVRVVYPGFDPAVYHPRPRTDAARLLRRRLGVTDGDVLAGLVTSGDWQKRGVATFIEALAIVARGSGSRVHGLITGKERSAGRYLALARERGIADRVRVLPPEPDLANVYGALDVFVYPAQLEEFGMCVQEAMACGLPVVCGRRIGATELLDRTAAALLLDSVTPATVAERLAAFVADENLRRQAGAVNAASVVRNTWDRSGAGVIAVYDELA